MRQITQNAATAFAFDRNFKRDNTEVRVSPGGTQLLLHDNIIAARFKGGTQRTVFTLAGWGTPTTRERINGLLEYLGYDTRVYQYKHEQWVRHEGKDYPISVTDDWYINSNNELEVL